MAVYIKKMSIVNKRMKLARAIVACDSNPNYLCYWELARNSWVNIVGIKCTLVLVADEIPEWLPYKEDVVLFKPIPGIHTAFQAQCIRNLWPGLVEDEGGAVIISDIDMMALQKSYFVDTIADVPEDSYVVYRGLYHQYKAIWMCYVAAAPAVWREVFGCACEDDVRRLLSEWHEGSGYTGQHGGQGWFVDQWKLYEYVYTRWNKRLVVFTDEQLKFRHLDKIYSNWKVLSDGLKQELLAGVYQDFCLPPFAAYKKEMTDIYDFLVASKGKLKDDM
jgi:hypothetical protein